MCKTHRTPSVRVLTATAIAAIGLAISATSFAQVAPLPPSQSAPILVPSTSSSYNQQGFNLPSIARNSGQDVIRGAGGISCQSAIQSAGPVFDAGIIGTNDIYSRDSAAIYGRVTVPLGRRPKRVDCTRLYEMELQRLKLEIELLRAGTMGTQRLIDVAEAPEEVESDLDDHYFPQPFVLGSLESKALPE